MREWPVGARVAVLALGAIALFVSLAEVTTRDDPYAPNDWLFSHAFLAQRAIDAEELPLNRGLLGERSFSGTSETFREQVGLSSMTFYANTIWHFWNGLPVQPALLASLALLADLSPEAAARVPVGGIALALLVFACADHVARPGSRAATFAPYLLVLACAPLVLDMRVLMPSASMVVVGILLLLLLRRQLVGDERALAYSVVPLALLPFWYYTVTYFVIALFAGFLAANLLLRWRGAPAPPAVPLGVALLVPLVLGAGLMLNGSLESHVDLAANVGIVRVAPESSGDYDSHLNRDPWRSALLYLELAALFVPLAFVAGRAAFETLRKRPIESGDAVVAQWGVGGAAFSVVLPSILGVSFLNRSAIYLAPLAVVAHAAWASRARVGRVAACVPLVVGAVATPLLVATAAPTYTQGDAEAFEWLEAHAAPDARVFSSLDVASVLFRAHGFHDVVAFPPRPSVLERLWYGTDPEDMVAYLASVDWLVLRDDVVTSGFEEFGPLREPISREAYDKFDRSRDLQRVFDNGEVVVFRVALAEDRILEESGETA